MCVMQAASKEFGGKDDCSQGFKNVQYCGYVIWHVSVVRFTVKSMCMVSRHDGTEEISSTPCQHLLMIVNVVLSSRPAPAELLQLDGFRE